MLWPIAKALLGHYKRHPLQMILVWLGLSLGISVLVGVLAINQHAKLSYTHGERLFSSPLPYRIQSKNNSNTIPQGFYVQIRREGFSQCIPFDLYRTQTKKGADIQLLGIDSLATAEVFFRTNILENPILNLMEQPHPVLINETFMKYMGWHEGQQLTLNNGKMLGPLVIDQQNLVKGSNLVVDMAVTRKLRQGTGFSLIGCGNMSQEKLDNIRDMLPDGVILRKNTRSELVSLTEAFHLNLTAMGMLSFLIGLFIFYQAMSLSFVQRQTVVGVLRQIGVSGWQLVAALMLELFILVTISWISGNVLGLMLANQLLPAVSMSIGAIYNASIDLVIHWRWAWSAKSLLLSLVGVALSCTWPLLRLIRTQPIRLTARLSLVRFAGREFFWQAVLAAICLFLAVFILQFGEGVYAGFSVLAFMLIGVALMVPYIIFELFTYLSYRLRWVKARWFFADAAASMSYRGVALMAFMLAITANVGVETMVGSFRNTTDQWLSQRLAADIYVHPSAKSASKMVSWLDNQPEVKEVWQRRETELTTLEGNINLVSIGNSLGEKKSLTAKVSTTNYWHHLHHSRSVMISESMSLKRNIRVGDYISLPAPVGQQWRVVGVYYDYGNPYDQVLLSENSWNRLLPGQGSVGLGVVLNDKAQADVLTSKLVGIYRIPADRVVNNTTIHQQALKIFDRTFGITDTLGNLTLIVALFGIFFATLAGEASRLHNVALLRCLGVSGKELVFVGGAQLFAFGIVSSCVAIPLGMVLASNVVELILKKTFGWSMQLHVVPWDYLGTLALTVSALMLAGAIPVLQVIRRTPMKSLRDAL
ncbi:ABC transporter permease [Vibrio sp. UCD-FRSSP16_10]|uniref:ABC transporter permease n=1 Tax=unclassified Vibrio TaxID=2614977 RepID=UPI0007FEF737|nr:MULTISPECIES: ABC transporter permease [unclassified Vibrio]OBT13476.1 ABC transporter permease [Vibrio sp. UCD-FRSSP16_10]OBT17985.1 ABC transporter permease [Vibrio sp. UCD-FRSSP16_30]